MRGRELMDDLQNSLECSREFDALDDALNRLLGILSIRRDDSLDGEMVTREVNVDVLLTENDLDEQLAQSRTLFRREVRMRGRETISC
ncbi:hypothetical protein PENTCL1PPCAC_29280 [Pristionchus entomophagus]|uniref:Uncharacterized protein n=1 Tax=Pristionchus entomophagus TaxID=358040 RepID=A0AAV5UJ84_9BILA|nr:hypothetical protein PENTCL1PPCAC_29280 [Pristionchus entomophagus]